MKPYKAMLIAITLFAGTVLAQQTAIQFATQIIPSAYDPSLQIPQFADLCPDMTLPAGHVYVKPPTKQGWTTAQIMAKGATHWASGGTETDAYYNTTAPYNKKKYNNVPQIRSIFGETEFGDDHDFVALQVTAPA